MMNRRGLLRYDTQCGIIYQLSLTGLFRQKKSCVCALKCWRFNHLSKRLKRRQNIWKRQRVWYTHLKAAFGIFFTTFVISSMSFASIVNELTRKSAVHGDLLSYIFQKQLKVNGLHLSTSLTSSHSKCVTTFTLTFTHLTGVSTTQGTASSLGPVRFLALG